MFAFMQTYAQDFQGLDDDMYDSNNTFNPNAHQRDTTKSDHKQAPRGMYVWTIDKLFGERTLVPRDTVHHLFMNQTFTTGMHGEYNTTGNIGAPRINRIFMDRKRSQQFMFAEPYDFFLTPVSELRFTNTLSPITNLYFTSCGDRTDGEDHLKASFATNINKQAGFGFRFNYIYGRGYYQNQSTSLFDYTMWASYLGERYQAHLAFSIDHMKNTENGGITDDNYITHPESITDSYTTLEIPVNLSSTWNRNHFFNIFFNHKYNIGFNRKVPMTEMEKEAHRFALAAKKEAQEREKASKAKKDGKTEQRESLGRPDGAKIVGDLVASDKDSLNVNSDRISVPDKATADSLLAVSEEAKEDTSWLKNEYVPVTSFIHTLDFTNRKRTYISYYAPTDYYYNHIDLFEGVKGDSIYDDTRHYSLKNTFALALLEGFNKYMKTGFKAYITHDLSHYELPDTISRTTSFNENNVYIGAQLIKTQGRAFHYIAKGEIGMLGETKGEIRIDADADVNIPLLKDTLRVELNGFFHLEKPTFYMRHYHSKHYWWDNDLDKQIHTHIEGRFHYPKTKTSLRVAVDNLEKYTYLAQSYNLSSKNLPVDNNAFVRQTSKNVNLLTAQLEQNFRVGILNWENIITYQKSTVQEVLPVPDLNIWSNLYLNLRIARVLRCHFGADVTYFTTYNAPEYCPGLGQYAVQENEAVKRKVGNYPFVNVYANFLLKGCRFYVMMSHVNAGQGNLDYFITPHYPMNDRIFRLGISWNFFN